jgi:hypothetical protein
VRRVGGQPDGRTGGPAGRRAVVTGAILAWLSGCGAVGRDTGKGRLEAAWTGAEKGKMSGAATAVWCRATRIAQITALQGDTGLGILIHATDSLAAGRYSIVEPASARTTAARATLGLRLLTQMAVVGYQGHAGTLTLDRVERSRISGRFDAKANVVGTTAGSISVSGRFHGVPVAPGGPACPP